MEFQPGALIKLRNRDWVVLPSNDADLLLVKPLGGSDDEITGIFLPLQLPEEKPISTDFEKPSSADISDFASAKLLYNASRLSFRNAAGPFRSLARLSFRPRSYQMVPLIMALKQDVVRLLIADDVGVGKTIEAGLIIRELIDRGEIKRFSVICLPHLCDQWQEELKNKFGIEAEVFRSSTAAKLDRKIRGDQSPYRYYPYQVISIDYIKTDQHKHIFLDQSPELIVVDEAHTCARPKGSQTSQQQRYHLMHDLAAIPKKHLILLTATPHSGKQEEFQSLLGLLHQEYEKTDITVATSETRKEIARHFIQRKRDDISQWLGEETHFPERKSAEDPYELSAKYRSVFAEVIDFAQELVKTKDTNKRQQRLRYWTALALLRGVMSSPATGVEMLRKRAVKQSDDALSEYIGEDDVNPVFDDDTGIESDAPPIQVVENVEMEKSESKTLNDIANRLDELKSLQHDLKASRAYSIVKGWIKEGFHPIIFCRYIATANYLGEILRPELSKEFPNLDIQVITSELPDDLRKEKIAELGKKKQRLLIATDCLSEGVNLQDGFTAVMHYDLPWNPNRLEQREGRIDRFGQIAPIVKVSLLYGKDNPIDGVVLRVLIRKAREIRQSTGITVPFPEDSKSIMDAVLNAVLLNPNAITQSLSQMKMDFGEGAVIAEKENEVSNAYTEAGKRQNATRSIFAQHSIKANEIEQDLKEADEAIGNVKSVEEFVLHATRYFGAQITSYKDGYRLFTTNLPKSLTALLEGKDEVLLSFKSPTPEGYKYLGRNHAFVELLCAIVMSDSLNKEKRNRPSRTAVIKTSAVKEKTTLIQFRVRNVITEVLKKNELVAEEMLLWGYSGDPKEKKYLKYDKAKELLFSAQAELNMTPQEQKHWLDNEMKIVEEIRQLRDELAIERAEHLVESHERFRKVVVGGKKYKAVEPILPMDILGVYILLPKI